MLSEDTSEVSEDPLEENFELDLEPEQELEQELYQEQDQDPEQGSTLEINIEINADSLKDKIEEEKLFFEDSGEILDGPLEEQGQGQEQEQEINQEAIDNQLEEHFELNVEQEKEEKQNTTLGKIYLESNGANLKDKIEEKLFIINGILDTRKDQDNVMMNNRLPQQPRDAAKKSFNFDMNRGGGGLP